MKVRIQKLDPNGEVKYKYGGTLLEQDAHRITIEAFFDRDDMPFQNVIFKKGDRFLEYYYFDRWYNIFEIYDRDDGNIKGWYCNVGKPAKIEDGVLSYVDLALDLWVSADGTQTVLDEEEFDELGLDNETRTKALNGLKELQFLLAT